MSRVLKPVTIPSGISIKVEDQTIIVKGNKGELTFQIDDGISMKLSDTEISFAPKQESNKSSIALTGTTKALVNNMIIGVGTGFEKKLTLVGVGYRAQAKGNSVNISVGYSHPIEHAMPDGIQVTTPSQTEIVISGIDKQQVGQVAADIRAYRPPEPYKGKGIRYADEYIARKEAKKK